MVLGGGAVSYERGTPVSGQAPRPVPLDPLAGADLVAYALTQNAVELIPTLGAHFPRGGSVQEPVLTWRGVWLANYRPQQKRRGP